MKAQVRISYDFGSRDLGQTTLRFILDERALSELISTVNHLQDETDDRDDEDAKVIDLETKM